MSKYPCQIKNLPKFHQRKYFSHETGGGKGDTRREFNPAAEQAYRDNYDRIFNKQTA